MIGNVVLAFPFKYCASLVIISLLGNKLIHKTHAFLDVWQHYDAIMRYISQPPLLLDVHIHKPMLNARTWMDSLLAFFPGLQVRCKTPVEIILIARKLLTLLDM